MRSSAALLLLLLAAASVCDAQAPCSVDVDCDVPRAFCDLRTSGRCRCKAGFTSWLAGCLPVQSLGQQCQVSPQCRALHEHAVCDARNHTCQCRDGYQQRGGHCAFRYHVTTPAAVELSEAEVDALPAGLREAARARQRRQHQASFVRGLAVTAVLTALTLLVFVLAAVVSRRVRRREMEYETAAAQQKMPPPPPYSVTVTAPDAEGDTAAAAAAAAAAQYHATPPPEYTEYSPSA